MFQSPNKAKRVLAYALAALIVFPNAAFAQAPSKPAEAATAAQKVQLLFVQNSAGVLIDSAKGTLRLENVSPFNGVLHRSPGTNGWSLPLDSTGRCNGLVKSFGGCCVV